MKYSVSEKLIAVEGVEYSINGKKILRNIGNEKIPFEIYDLKKDGGNLGQIIAVIGRSGSGKSSLFKIITGLVNPTQGQVLIPNVEDLKQHKKVTEGDVGFVQQNYPLSRNQSIKEMLETACRMGKISDNESSKTIDDYLNDWGLYEHRNKYSNQLSGGQRQRVAIIEQLLCSHHFMVFDEPFSGLDIGNILDVKNCFRKIADQNDINTIIFSTHDIDLAVEIADLIYVIGFEKEGNHILEGGTMIEKIDLKENGLAWKEYSSQHKELSNHICSIMLQSSK